MSESQFAYSGFTLDELRSLAASPQVGTMQAMPQSFRNLAERVGEVANLLTHAQADLPNWWKGPAAEQAAATLGRAAAEAREFHGSALAAASAVSRCAQVVAEQQHQMMSLPELAEPGITDVVQRPTTPFEALEAARQDARYQAVHEQAVQVVNGIAAQYVETRNQLSSIEFFRGENFSTPTATSQPAGIPSAPLNSSFSESPETNHTTTVAPNARHPEIMPDVTNEATGTKVNLAATRKQTRRLPATAHDSESAVKAFSVSEAKPAMPVEAGPSLKGDLFASTPARDAVAPLAASLISEDLADHRRQTNNRRHETSTDATPNPLPGKPAAQANARQERGSIENDDASTKFERTSDLTFNAAEGPARPRNEMHYPISTAGTGQQAQSAIKATGSSQPLPTENPQSESPAGANAAIIPPYGSIGTVHNEREHRNPRPAYLKERKSLWLPDTFAAPPDGVIGPDWLEQL